MKLEQVKLSYGYRFIRGEHYEYTYTKFDSIEASNGYWWNRKRIGTYFPIVDLKTLRSVLEQQGWKL